MYLLKEELVRKLCAVEKDITLLEKTAKEYIPVYPEGEQWAAMTLGQPYSQL